MTPGHGSYCLVNTIALKQLRTKQTMFYIWLSSVTMYAGSIGKKYPYVVEHGGSLNLV